MAKGDLNEFIRTGFIGAITLLAGFGVDQVRGMSKEMSQLNEKMAVVVQQVTRQDSASEDHERRIRALEINCVACARLRTFDGLKIEAQLGR